MQPQIQIKRINKINVDNPICNKIKYKIKINGGNVSNKVMSSKILCIQDTP